MNAISVEIYHLRSINKELLEAAKAAHHWLISRGHEGIGEVGKLEAAIAKAEVASK